jgi:pyrroline-5-carboxylate reductase
MTQALNQTRITFIGGGNMTRGLLGGLLGHGVPPSQITVSAPSEATRLSLSKQFGVQVSADNAAAVATADVVVLSVKPQLMAAVVRPLAATLQARKPLVISVAAGLRAQDLSRWVGPGIAVVRSMPNRPALTGAGATGLYADDSVNTAQRKLAEDLLACTGIALWVSRESDIDLVTALSGSGPAYFFRVAELMAEAAIAQGLDATVARQLAAQTLAGAGKLVAAEPAPDLAAMRMAVTSKGGTTEAALNEFAAQKLDTTIAAGMAAAARRGRELAEQFGVL